MYEFGFCLGISHVLVELTDLCMSRGRAGRTGGCDRRGCGGRQQPRKRGRLSGGGQGGGEALPGVRGSLTEIRPEVGFGQ